MDRGIEGKNRCNDHIRAGGSIAIYDRGVKKHFASSVAVCLT